MRDLPLSPRVLQTSTSLGDDTSRSPLSSAWNAAGGGYAQFNSTIPASGSLNLVVQYPGLSSARTWTKDAIPSRLPLPGSLRCPPTTVCANLA